MTITLIKRVIFGSFFSWTRMTVTRSAWTSTLLLHNPHCKTHGYSQDHQYHNRCYIHTGTHYNIIRAVIYATIQAITHCPITMTVAQLPPNSLRIEAIAATHGV